MSRSVDAPAARRALGQRLRAAAEVLLDSPPPAADPDPARDAAAVLDLLVRAVHAEPTPDRVWLLYLAVASRLPAADDVAATRRRFELDDPLAATLWLLDTCLAAARGGEPTRELRVVPGGVVVDVDHSARHDLHTGIQQVVRNTVPLWARDHEVHLVAWVESGAGPRALSQEERRRIVEWGEAPAAAAGQDADPGQEQLPLVVPWHGTVILPEVPPRSACERLAALAEHSGNRVSLIGYDCVPIVSADLVPLAEPNRFARYLTVVKHAHAVAAISVSAAAEFRGFADALPTQGLAGPQVTECVLPTEAGGVAGAVPQTAAVPAAVSDDGLPTVLCVGSFEPRKNHLALLYAAERLWRDGFAFRLRLIGGSGWGADVPRRVRRLQSHGRPVTIEQRVGAPELSAAYREATFTVFASLHEGYGLPVAESLAAGTPVITSDFGSTREIGEGHGALLVDPRDDDALVEAMRLLLGDPDRLAQLRAEAAARPRRSWEEYAGETWGLLAAGAPSALETVG